MSTQFFHSSALCGFPSTASGSVSSSARSGFSDPKHKTSMLHGPGEGTQNRPCNVSQLAKKYQIYIYVVYADTLFSPKKLNGFLENIRVMDWRPAGLPLQYHLSLSELARKDKAHIFISYHLVKYATFLSCHLKLGEQRPSAFHLAPLG